MNYIDIGNGRSNIYVNYMSILIPKIYINFKLKWMILSLCAFLMAYLS